MKYTEFLKALLKQNVYIAPRTLQVYIKEGLITTPEGPRQGRGVQPEYSEDSPAEAYAAYRLLKEDNLKYSLIRDARAVALLLLARDYREQEDVKDDLEIRKFILETHSKAEAIFHSFEWLALKWEALGYKPDKRLKDSLDLARFFLTGLAMADEENPELFKAEYEAKRAEGKDL